MFEYMTVQEAAKLWEISERRIQKLCEENRIDGVVRLSRVWLIPRNAEKPFDGTVSLGQIDDSRHTVCSARRYESGCCKNNTLAA